MAHDPLTSIQELILLFTNKPPASMDIYGDPQIVFNTVLSEGDDNKIISFFSSAGRYDFLLDYFYERESYDKCLEILAERKSEKLTYNYAPLLMRKVPRKVCQLLIDQSHLLDPDVLLPTLIQGTDKETIQSPQCVELVKYLEHCFSVGSVKPIIFNSLVTLYAELDERKLYEFLETRNDLGRIYYDIDYAHKICAEKGLKKASVILYEIEEDFENAVKVALEVDMSIAKKIANRPTINNDLRRQLWLKIAQKVVEEGDILAQVSELISQSGLLRIEDILPFCPDFVIIDCFKDAVCSSLSDYLNQLDELKAETEEVLDNSQHIAQQIFSLKGGYISVKEEDKCAICGNFILNQPSQAFLCRHMYHSDCLYNEVQNYVGPTVLERLRKLQRPTKASDHPEDKSVNLKVDQIDSDQIQSLMHSQCLFCGDLMIESINLPLISFEEQNSALAGW